MTQQNLKGVGAFGRDAAELSNELFDSIRDEQLDVGYAALVGALARLIFVMTTDIEKRRRIAGATHTTLLNIVAGRPS